MNKLLIGVGAVFVVLLLLCGGLYFIFNGTINLVPKLLGTGEPDDLGITYTQQDLDNAEKQFNFETKQVNDSTKSPTFMTFEGSQTMNTSYDSKAISALLNNRKYAYSPVKNMQVRINEDDTVEWSGVINTENVPVFMSALGKGNYDFKEIEEKYSIPAELSFYVKGTASVTNNKVSMDTSEVKLGNFTVPQSIITGNRATFESFAEEMLGSIPNLYIEEMKIEDGKMNLKGTMPQNSVHQANPNFKPVLLNN